MIKIKEWFDRNFKYWDIPFPQEFLERRIKGVIRHRGWCISYIFGKNKKGEYLEFYASHRMTNDRHLRIYESGKVQGLATTGGGEFLFYGKNPTEKKILLVQKKAEQREKRVAAILCRRGLR
jgi:hypothetical protein